MMLCLDAGNSRLKAGLWDGAAWVWRQTLDYPELAGGFAALPAAPTRVVACNGAGDAVKTRLEALCAARGWPLDWLEASAERAGVRNGYRVPTQLGADRWAALIGARAWQSADAPLAGQALLIVMAGTATTIDALAADGRFQGGMILPGLALMRQSLARGTAQLPHALGEPAPWPVSTDEAIVSGALEATLGAIERLRARLAAAAPCLLAGGAAAHLRAHLAPPVVDCPDLVLDGLRRAVGE